MLQLSVKSPCQENWDQMLPAARGRYCRTCQKEVTDFSTMSDGEILMFLKNKSEPAGCGRFRIDQLERPIISISPDILQMNIPFWKKFLALLIICFSGFISGCGTKSSSTGALQAEVQMLKADPVIDRTPPGDIAIDTNCSESDNAFKTYEITRTIDNKDITHVVSGGFGLAENPSPMFPHLSNEMEKLFWPDSKK